METLFSHFSDWDSTSLSLNSETCPRAGHLKADDRRPLVSQSVTKTQSAPTELQQESATDKDKMKNAAMCLVGNSMPHHPGQSPLTKTEKANKVMQKPRALSRAPPGHALAIILTDPDSSLWRSLPCADSFYAAYSQTTRLSKVSAFSLWP